MSLARRAFRRLRRSDHCSVQRIETTGKGADVFVISSPRSGSTWLMRSVSAHPEVFVTEQRLFGDFAEFWLDRDGQKRLRITLDHVIHRMVSHMNHEGLACTSQDLEDSLLTSWSAATASVLRALSQSSIIIDKITPYQGTSENVLNSILKHYPRAKIIHLIRDGRDVVVSGVFDWIGRNEGGDDSHRARQDLTQVGQFFATGEVEFWSRTWVEPIQALRMSGVLHHEIRYELMLQDQHKELQRLFTWLGVDSSTSAVATCIESGSLLKKNIGENPLAHQGRSAKAGEWHRYFTPADLEQMYAICGTELRNLGYLRS
ncbi:MAG: sulfotransferase [Planctomycetota bacterium]